MTPTMTTKKRGAGNNESAGRHISQDYARELDASLSSGTMARVLPSGANTFIMVES